MPTFALQAVDSAFSTDVEVDRPAADDALAYGLQGALMIAAEEITAGRSASTVVFVKDAAGRPVRRSAVSVKISTRVVELREKESKIT